MAPGYPGRPAPSPTLAALAAAGVLHRGDRVLDVGCGTGVDAVAMVRWGVGEVVGIDKDARAIAAARRRARAQRVGRWVRFEVGDATRLEDRFEAGAFTAATDVLMVNNMRDEELRAYARGLGHVVAPRGLLVAHCRVLKRDFEDPRGPLGPPRALRKLFRFGPVAATALPERPARDRDPAYARVALWVGHRKG